MGFPDYMKAIQSFEPMNSYESGCLLGVKQFGFKILSPPPLTGLGYLGSYCRFSLLHYKAISVLR